jgi:putative transcriptional regulator
MPPIPYVPGMIELPKLLRLSILLAISARYLNVRTKLVSEWERGEKRPSGPSLKLLSIVKAKGLDAIA